MRTLFTGGDGSSGQTGQQVRNYLNWNHAPVFNVEEYGALGDGQVVYDAAITSGQNTLTCATSTPFTSSDVGKSIKVAGAGAAGVALVTTISGFTSSSVVTLTANASTTVSSKQVIWGTDDTAAIQAALDACLVDAVTGGGKVFLPRGIYIVAGALVTSKNTATTNAQLVIPPLGYGNGHYLPRLEIAGEVGNIPLPQRNQNVMTTGVVITSFITGSGTRPAVFGSGYVAGNPFNFNYTFVHIKNIQIQVNCNGSASAPTMSAWDGSEINWQAITDCCATIDSDVINSQNPSSSEVAGWIVGKENNSDINTLTRVTASGFKYNFVLGEHILLNSCFSTAGVNAYAFLGGSFNVSGFVSASQCINYLFAGNIAILGITEVSHIRQLDLVVETDGGVSSGKWYQPTTDVHDVGNYIYGNVTWNSGGANGLPRGNNGALNLNFRRLRSFLPMQSNQAGGGITPAGSDITVGNTLNWPVTELGNNVATSNDTKYPHLNLTTKQSGTSNIVGTIAAVNSVLGTTEKRLIRELYKTNGATNSGLKEVYAMLAGTLTLVQSITAVTSAFNVPVKLPSYTVAGAPSASVAGAGSMIYVTNEAGGACVAYSDGTNWKRVDTNTNITT